MNNKVEQLSDNFSVKGRCLIEIYDAKTGKLKSSEWYYNLHVTTGKNSRAAALAGNVANNKGQITYFAVGTGTDAPALGNTQLQTEIFRKQISVRSSSGNTSIFKTFLNQSQGNGTLREAGLFGDLATETADSGTLFCRLAIDRTKSSNDTLTATWYVTHS